MFKLGRFDWQQETVKKQLAEINDVFIEDLKVLDKFDDEYYR